MIPGWSLAFSYKSVNSKVFDLTIGMGIHDHHLYSLNVQMLDTVNHSTDNKEFSSLFFRKKVRRKLYKAMFQLYLFENKPHKK